MKNLILNITLVSTTTLMLSGCFGSNSELMLYKSKQEWVKEISEKIEDKEYDSAFESFEAFHLEHPNANKEAKPLLLTLANKYNEDLEYLKSIKLYDIYLKKYSKQFEKESIIFKQIEAKFNRLNRANHNYVLLLETKKNIEDLKPSFTDKELISKLDKMYKKIILKESEYNLLISNFYKKKGSEYGEKLYSNKIEVDTTKVDRKSYQPYQVWHSNIID